VNNMKRNVFLLLKRQGLSNEEHQMVAEDAFDEFKNKHPSLKKLQKVKKANNNSKSIISYKPVRRHYVFEREIGNVIDENTDKNLIGNNSKGAIGERTHIHGELQFCKIEYDGSYSAVSQDVHPDCETYTDIFGTQTSFLEMLFKKRSMKGPMWLRIKNPYSGNDILSTCVFEAHLRSHKDLFSPSDIAKKNIKFGFLQLFHQSLSQYWV